MISKKRAVRNICVFSLIIFLISIAMINKRVSAVDDEGPTDIKELESFSDNIFNRMESYKVPGAVLVVVKDGKVILKKGYGYADLEKKLPVDPDKTVFRVGSVSKLFTATALMQLKEQGKVDFHDNVNKYLSDMKIKDKFSKPVTIENLLTHTAGFDEQGYTGQFLTNVKDVDSMSEDNLKKHVPKIIREPGQVTQYSNYGFNLQEIFFHQYQVKNFRIISIIIF